MIIVVDASTLINLANGEVLAIVLGLSNVEFHVSSVVRRESRTVADAIDGAVATKRLTLVDDTLVSAAEFEATKLQFNLDDGETECIVAARVLDATVACDDAAARRAIREVLGKTRLSGSAHLLRSAVSSGLLATAGAIEAYALMRARGGYLPILAANYFG